MRIWTQPSRGWNWNSTSALTPRRIDQQRIRNITIRAPSIHGIVLGSATKCNCATNAFDSPSSTPKRRLRASHPSLKRRSKWMLPGPLSKPTWLRTNWPENGEASIVILVFPGAVPTLNEHPGKRCTSPPIRTVVMRGARPMRLKPGAKRTWPTASSRSSGASSRVHSRCTACTVAVEIGAVHQQYINGSSRFLFELLPNGGLPACSFGVLMGRQSHPDAPACPRYIRSVRMYPSTTTSPRPAFGMDRR
jgi:hypothetical protein